VITVVFRDPAHVWNYLFVSCLCSVVIGLGFHALPPGFLEPARGRSPRMAVWRMQVKWLGICLLLVAPCLGLLQLIFGRRLDAATLTIVPLVALLITSLAVGQHTATALVARTRSLEQSRTHAGFLALQAQIQPHTLFNALNTILALVRTHPEQAEAATRHLSRLLRRTTAALDQEAWPLADEFQLLEALLELERLRFGDRLSYTLTLAEDLRDRRVPPLLLVPLVENSLKHGFRAKVGPCALTVVAEGRTLRVADDGLGRPVPAAEGVGLRTVRERLEALGGRMSWPETSTGCVVELELP
jgi:two-component sensor histidine kinase